MLDAILALPVNVRARLVAAFNSGSLDIPCSPTLVRSALGVAGGAEAICSEIAALQAMGISAKAAGALIAAFGQAVARVPTADLVCSGPEVPDLHARQTRRVYEELLRSAERSLLVTTYAFFDGTTAFETLAERMDAITDLDVLLLLNIQRKATDTSAPEQVVRRFADRFWKKDWPGARRPHVFYDPRSLEIGGSTSCLHAKALVADDEAVFITSANLTDAALDRNIEMGLLVRDRALAASVSAHFRALIDRTLLRPLPAS